MKQGDRYILEANQISMSNKNISSPQVDNVSQLSSIWMNGLDFVDIIRMPNQIRQLWGLRDWFFIKTAHSLSIILRECAINWLPEKILSI